MSQEHEEKDYYDSAEEAELRKKMKELFQKNMEQPMTPERLRKIDDLSEASDEDLAFALAAAEELNEMSEEEVNKEIAAFMEETSLPEQGEAPPIAIPKKKNKSLLPAAAIVLAVGIGVTAVALYITPADADKNQGETEDQTGQTTIVKETNDENGPVINGQERVVTAWEEVPNQKAAFPDLYIPSYVPEGYTFEQLVIEGEEGGRFTAEYQFSNNEGLFLYIHQFITSENDLTSGFLENSEKVDVSGETIYIQKPEGDGTAITGTAVREKSLIDVAGNINSEKICEILKGLKQ